MREPSNQVPEGELDSTGPNDVFAKVMGKEKSSSVRMYGLGVCPSYVWGEVPSNGMSYKQSMEWKTELDKTNKKLEELMHLFSKSGANGVNPSNILVTSPSQQQHVGSSTSTSQRGLVKVSDFAYFKSVVNPIEIIGKGMITSLDPSKELDGEELGANWCEIDVQLPIKWNEHLMRPYRGLKTVGDAIGTPIAWPISLIRLMPNIVYISSLL
ncbi:hypothetical protein Vadar_023734 [Vaccinium darrowii]|uniref:Uncharacterized protein n=1 Tax=Vaccinium darrowii TaxID=229202 RepID=A0ACB7X353_9ERIC|nr:hypothetical protein Vadar_023734 [Vaccinium darrowii]